MTRNAFTLLVLMAPRNETGEALRIDLSHCEIVNMHGNLCTCHCLLSLWLGFSFLSPLG